MAAPITAADVAKHLGSPHPDANLDSVVDAVVAMVEGWKATPVEQWPEQWRLGTIMLIARIDRRRNSPAGVDTVTELGPVYVARKDPDVAQLLQLGAWAVPEVG
jgi:hypothetical protein